MKRQKENGRKCYQQGFFVILKLDLNALECRFLCLIHGPQNCRRWMKNAFRCWNLCFHMIVWHFNPVDTIHLFLWEKIIPFGFGVIASLWFQTTGFGVCLWQSFNNSPGYLSNTQRQRMTIEKLILNGQVHTLLSGNKALSETKMLASQYIETVWRNFLHVSWTV